MTTPQRATTHYLKSVTIDSPRYAKDVGSQRDSGIDVTAITAEINLYESIYEPFITGDLMIVDTSGITQFIKATGQETVRIEVYVDEDNIVTREFALYAVRKLQKLENSSSSVYVYSLIEKHGYFSYFQRLNRGYTGNISDIIFKVYKNELYFAKESDDAGIEDIEKNILNQDNFERAAQTVKIVSPNKTPLGLCMMLARRATSEYGEPFFLYSSLKEGPQFRSLGSLLQANPINAGKPYRYSQVYTQTNFADEIYRIISLDIPEQDNTIELAKSGAFGVEYQSIDPFYKTNDRALYIAKFDQDKHFNRKRDAGRTPARYNIYDKEFRVGGRSSIDDTDTPVEGQTLSELNSQIHSAVNTGGAFGEWKGFDEEPNMGLHLHKVRRKSDMAFLDKQKMTVIVPGYTMLNQPRNTSIGKMIDIRIPSDIVHFQTPDGEDKVDAKKSEAGQGGGLYLITQTRHSFGLDATYTASLEVAKISSATEL